MQNRKTLFDPKRKTGPAWGCKLTLACLIGGAGVAAGCTGSLDGGGPGDGDNKPSTIDPNDFNGPPVALRRLLQRHYTNSIRDVLGTSAELAADPPEDSSLNGFDAIASAQLSLGDAEVKAYESSARSVAAAALGETDRIDELMGCSPSGPSDSECHQSYVVRTGRLLFRRTLTDVEVSRYVDVASAAATELDDFYAGIEYATAAMLQSPHFLYQVEIGQVSEADPTIKVLSGLEMATRMSYVLVGTTPSEALLDAAEAGELDTPEGIRSYAETMVESPEAREALGAFYDEVFRLRDLRDVAKDEVLFPEFDETLVDAMRQETLALIDNIAFEQDGDFTEILDAPYTFVNADLAAFYNLPAPSGSGFQKVDLPTDEGRDGLLGQASLLSTLGHNSSSSPTLRGKFVRETLLCESIPAPPPDVVVALPPDEEAKTMKEKLSAHQTNPSCSGCHIAMDNIGLGLEQFDGIGRFRTTENDVTIDPTADLDGDAFVGPKELGTILRTRPKVASCMVRNLFRGATAHVENPGESKAIDALTESFEDSGFRIKVLLVDLASSEAFRFAGVAQ